MVAINATVVSVALPLIGLDLGLSEVSLVWIVDAYLVTSGGFLLLGGRLGDLYGRRRLFLLGTAIFTVASLGCGLAGSSAMLIATRAAQGLGGAIVSATALSQIVTLFAHAPKRAKALGTYVFVSAGGGSIGLLLGGALTNALGWHWIFLANVPIGICVCVLCTMLMPTDSVEPVRGRLDIAGAMTATASLVLAIYTIMKSHQVGWGSAQTVTLLAGSGALLLIFVAIEARVQTPVMPLELFRIRNFTIVCVVGALLTAAVLAWRFISSLYLQLVLELSPLQIGLTFLPADLTIAVMSLAVAPTLVSRLGTRWSLVTGMLIISIGLAFLARAPASASVMLDVLPGMFLLGLGAGLTYNPLFLSALSGVAVSDSGSASGIVNTSYTVGGALGLSLLASIAAARTDALLTSGVSSSSALSGGYRVAFCLCAVLALVAALISGAFLHNKPRRDPENVGTEASTNIC